MASQSQQHLIRATQQLNLATVASTLNNKAVQVLQLSDLHGAIEVGGSFGAATSNK